MSENKRLHVHFMGICGSGCASIALLASHQGFRVSGCDVSVDSYYAGELKKENIPISEGHDPSHLKDVDIVAVSPALFDIAPDNPELLQARDKGILMTWQEFMGKYLQADKRVVAIAGTHGKTTTTFLTSEILIDADLDPSVVGGSVYHAWGSGGRVVSSDIFVCEADEFNRNFYAYRPEVAVLTTVEMDHPECYRDFEDMLEAYCHFVRESGNLKKLVINGDSEGALEVVRRTEDVLLSRNAEVYAFTRKMGTMGGFRVPIRKVLYFTGRKDPDGTEFTVIRDDCARNFSMKLFGEYNVSNAVTAIITSELLGVSDDQIQKTLDRFTGVGRRFDRVGECLGVPVFDDYAHHPTEISAVLTMVRDYYKDKRILAVFEPHQVSRLRLMFDGYVNALAIADRAVIGKTHMGREIHKNVVPITKAEWESASDRIYVEENQEKEIEYILDLVENRACDLIVVIGAANSYKMSRRLCEAKED